MSPLILLTLIPTIGWALGDFFIQKTIKRTGVVNTLFYIGLLGAIALFPFVFDNLYLLTQENFLILTTTGLLTFIYATLLFKALEVGKLSVVESIVALELPMTVSLSLLFLNEKISDYQLYLIVFISIGIFLSTLKWNTKEHKLKMLLEKGSFFAFIGSALSAFTNFTIGATSQSIDPVFTIWFTHLVLAIFCILYLFVTGTVKKTFNNIFLFPKTIALSSFTDNIAWLSYAFLVTLIPISIVISISEVYIVLAALMGYFINKEKLKLNQKIGMLLTFTAVILLSLTV